MDKNGDEFILEFTPTFDNETFFIIKLNDYDIIKDIIKWR